MSPIMPRSPDVAMTLNQGAPTGSRETRVERESNPIRRWLQVLGPGLVTGASDDDPSGIGTYASAGAALGYAPLWIALVTFPLMAAVQFICAKVGLVTGRGLAGVLRHHYSRWLLYPVLAALLIANTINAGADMGAIAAGLNLIVPQVPISAFILPVCLLILALQIWASYRFIARTFKWLTLTLFAYVGAAFLAKPDALAVLHGTLVPSLQWDSKFLAMLVAILGTTISPYLFFWQASQEVEEQIAAGSKRLWQRRGASDRELRYAAWDVNVGMFFSNIVMYFIILATAAKLYTNGITDIESAEQAAMALEPLAGSAAKYLFALGLVGAGILAVPILTASGAYAVAETFGWKCGLDRAPGAARAFYTVIAVSTGVGLLFNFLGINPVKALFWTAVINGLLAPPLLVLIMFISSNRAVMGARVNGPLLSILGWFTAGAMGMAALGLFLTWSG